MPDGHARLRMCLEHEDDVRVRDLTPFFEMPDRAVYRADTDRPGLVVRVFPPTRSSERVACDTAVLQYAAAAGIPAEPSPAGQGHCRAEFGDGLTRNPLVSPRDHSGTNSGPGGDHSSRLAPA